MENVKEEILFEDETMVIKCYSNLRRICLEAKTQSSYEMQKAIFVMLPQMQEIFKAMLPRK